MVDRVVTAYLKVQPEVFVGGPWRVIPVTRDRGQWQDLVNTQDRTSGSIKCIEFLNYMANI
jgi:hypothetical protein